MGTVIAVAIGGALGSVARYALNVLAENRLGADFPWGILIVNVLGSFAIGVLFVLLVERPGLSEAWRAFLMVGFLGGFTTFSTFSLQALELLQTGRYLESAAYVLGSMVLSIIGCLVGILLMRHLGMGG